MDTQRAIARVLQDFTAKLLEVFSQALVDAVAQLGEAATPRVEGAVETRGRPRKVAAPAAAPSKAARPARAGRRRGAVTKSSPEEVNRLGERIVTLLRKSSADMAAREIMSSLRLDESEEGRFQYALSKLKEEGQVEQHGARRGARYAAA